MRRLRRPGNRPRVLAAECLEYRTLLSNIAVTDQAGAITLAGDTGNHTVAATVANGDLHLVGTNGTEFTFNGTTAATVDVPLNGIVKSIRINMPGSGNNDITFDATNLPTVSGNVTANFGSGTDSLLFENANVKGKISVTAGNGADTFQLTQDTAGSVSVHAGNGGDTIGLSNVTIASSLKNDDIQPLVIATGSGNDTITLDSVVSAGKGSRGEWLISAGAGNNAVSLTNVTDHGSLDVTTPGAGTDTVTIDGSNFKGTISILAGNGADTFTLTNDVTGGVSIRAGNGGDTVALSNVTIVSPAHEGDNDRGDNDRGDNDRGDKDRGDKGHGHSKGEENDDKGNQPLLIATGSGDDTITLDNVVSAGTAFGAKWNISAGAGNNTIALTNVQDHGFLDVSAKGTGNDTATIDGSTFGKQVQVSLPNGTETINLSGDTFNGKASFSTGTGSGSTISVDDSTFRTVAVFTMAGPNATLNLESTDTAAGSGTVFNGPVFIQLTGASAIANLGVNTVGDTLTFEKVVHITGGSPAAVVNVMDANVTLAHKLLLKNATRVDV